MAGQARQTAGKAGACSPIRRALASAEPMRFCILGPLELWEDGNELRVGGGRQRALLLLLMLHANEVVSTDRLIDALWPGMPPATAGKIVQTWISQLRKVLPES